MLDHLRSSLKINILAVEYPSYGIYTDEDGCASEKILEDADTVFNFALQHLDLKPRDLLLFGRSLGSGPAIHLAAKYNPGALILMSPYTSIKNVVRSKVPLISWFVAEHFDNLSQMHNVVCPTFIVHGQKDSLIPFDHAQQLNE
mmetsp:Transcript_11595/g.8470  ORF Transcript_11595/g.8470 Transcript_11595/m.8470 type:complete len:144 (+) Transcript_11595:233-664(+)